VGFDLVIHSLKCFIYIYIYIYIHTHTHLILNRHDLSLSERKQDKVSEQVLT